MAIILFTHEDPGFYQLSQIFDSVTNPDGQIIPRIGSMVLDQANGNTLLVVDLVDDVTFNSTYSPAKTSLAAPDAGLDSQDSALDSVISYGNTRFYLFFDTRETPTKLTIDKKLMIPGNDAENYTITKKNLDTGDMDPISLYYEDEVYQGNHVPLVLIDGSLNAKYCTNCHTGVPIEDDEIYYLLVYDYTGVLTGSYKLYARTALVSNTLNDDLLIEDFVLNGSQEADDEFYLYPGQDVGSLVISPTLEYNNGKTLSIPIDGNLCHIYGLEGFVPSFPGQETTVLVKYFLGDGQQAAGDFVDSSGGTRFLYKTKKVVVITPADSDFIYKLSVMPYYLTGTTEYTLLFVLYEVGSAPMVVNQYITYDPADFDGQEFDENQTIEFSFDLKDIHNELENSHIVLQNATIRLAPFDYYERYTIRDNPADEYGIYGVDAPELARPVVYYDGSIEKYFIPTSKFANQVSVIEAFYNKARPVFDTELTAVPVVPTHFTVRDITTGSIQLADPIAIADYAQSWAILDANPDLFSSSNCIVEFLKDQGGGIFDHLYGVPVDVYDGVFV